MFAESPGVIKSTVTSVVIEIIWIQGDTRRNVAGDIRLISTPCSAANKNAIKIEPLSTAVECASNPGRIMPNLLSRTAYTEGINTHEKKLMATTNTNRKAHSAITFARKNSRREMGNGVRMR